jgi:hypothetical protein
VLLELDLGLRREPEANELSPHAFTEVGLREEQEVVARAADDPQRGDHARLRIQQQRVARLAVAERGDFVRDHALEQRLRIGAGHAHERTHARRGGDTRSNATHRH